MLNQMLPEELNERMAYELVIREQPEQHPPGITPDDPDFERKLLGMIDGITG